MEQSLQLQRASINRQIASQAASVETQRRSVRRQPRRSAPDTTPNWFPPVAPQDSVIKFACDPIPEEQLAPDIDLAAEQNDLPSALLRSVVAAESAFVPCAISRKGAAGLMQIMPATAKSLGLLDLMDPRQNLTAGASYLGQLLARYGGDFRLALSAYNAGPGQVDRYGDVPPFPETQDYVRKILTEFLGPSEAVRQVPPKSSPARPLEGEQRDY